MNRKRSKEIAYNTSINRKRNKETASTAVYDGDLT